MIRVTSTVEVKSIDRLLDFIGVQDQLVQGIVTQVYQDNAPALLQRLQTMPAPAKKPIDWTSDKQRRYVMAKLREDNNLPYQRTGKLASSWEVRNESTGNSFSIIVRNTAPMAKYVYGTLARDPVAAARFKQQFHTNTGWIFAGEVTQEALQQMEQQFRTLFRELTRDYVLGGTKTKAFTR